MANEFKIKNGAIVSGSITGITEPKAENSTKMASTAWVKLQEYLTTLPVATASVLGAVKIGSGLAIDQNGVLSIPGAASGTLRTVQSFTATEGQTTFTIEGGYTAGLIDVYLNGVLLAGSSVGASNGSTVVLVDAAEAGDIISVVTYSPLNNGFVNGTTDSLVEGTTNLFFTTARARASVAGTAGRLTYNSTTGVFDLATSGATAGTYGSSTAVPVVTVDAYGRVTGITTASISGALTFTGDVTGTGTTGTSTTLTLANSGVTAGTYNNSATQVRPFTVDVKGRITSIGTAVTITPAWSSITGTPTTLAGYGILDAYTKTEVDNLIQGLDPKGSVKAATTANITLSGTQTVDGVALVAGDRVLVKDQTTASANGIYVVAAGAWTRATDADSAAELVSAFVFVEQGTANADTAWVCATDSITLGTTSISFVQFAGTGAYQARLNGTGFVRMSGTSVSYITGTSSQFVKADGSLDSSTYLTGNQSISLSGDATGSGTTSIAVTLANSGVTAGSYGSSSAVPVITVDAKGRVTGVTTASISGALTFSGDVTGTGTTGTTTTLTLANSGATAGTYNNVTVNAKGLVTAGSNVAYLTANQTVTISGDASGSGATAITLTLANSGVTAGTYNTVTVNAKGLVTSGSNAAYLTGNQTITISGDATGSGTTAIPVTLVNSGVTAGTYRSVTVDAKGRVTAGTNPTTVSGYGITDILAQVISGFVVGANSTVTTTDTIETAIEKLQGQVNARLTANQSITLSGDATGSGTTAITVTLANSGVTAGTYTKVTVDAKGRVTSGTTLAAGDIPSLSYLALSGGTLTGNLTVGVTSGNAAIITSGNSTIGGATYFDFLRATSTAAGATNATKSLRINSTGGLEIINSAYTGILFNLKDNGQLALPYYTSSTSFTGTATAVLAVDASGNLITQAVSAGGGTTLNGTGYVYMSGTTPSYVTGTSSQFVKANGTLDSTSYLSLTGGTTTGVVTFGGSNNTTDNVRFLNTDGNYAYIRVTAANNSNNIWFDGVLGSVMWYGWDNPGGLRTANTYTQHYFGTGRGTSNESVNIIRGAITGTNSSGATAYTITRDGAITAASFTRSGGTSSQFLKADGSVDSTAYISSLTDTLATVTARGASTSTALSLSGQLVQGGGSARSTLGTTIAITRNTAFTANADTGDGERFLSIVNESSTASAMSMLSFRINPNGGASNAMHDYKFVNNGSNNSTVYWSFNSSGGFNDRMSLTSAGVLSINGNIALHAGNYNSYSPSLTGGGASGTWGINITGSAASITGTYSGTLTSSQVTTALGYTPYNSTNPSGYITSSADISGYSARLFSADLRTISPSSHAAYRITAGFTSWANNNSSPYADYIHLRSYSDSSGGSDNLIMFLKSGIGMRIWQQSWGSATAYSSYVDVLHSSNYNSYSPTLTGGGASGTWGINITGNAASASSVAWSGVTGKPTTISGYGITDALYQASTTIDVNAFNSTGLYRGSTSGWSNRPTVVHNGGALLQIDTHPGNYHQQLFFDTGGNRLYMRSADAGTWGSWVTMWHSGNLTNLNQLTNGPGYITSSSLSSYLALSGGTMTGKITTPSSGSDVYGGAIEIRERGYVLATQSDWSYSPAITFHWGNRWAKRFGGRSDGQFAIDDVPIVLNTGTWGISITGNAATASSASAVAWGNVTGRPGWLSGGSYIETLSNANSQVNSGFYENGGGGTNWPSATWYNSINVRHSNQGNYHGFQIAMSYYDNNFWFRSYQGTGTFQSWAVALSSQNYNSYSPTLTGGGASGTWGINVTGSAGSAGTVTHNSGRTDGTAYPVVWASGGSSPLYSCAAVTITSSTGTLTATNFTETSSIRYKENVIDLSNPLEKVSKLRGVSYNRKGTSKTEIGVIAEEVLPILPEVITHLEDGQIDSVAYGRFTALLIEAVKEQQKQINELKELLNNK